MIAILGGGISGLLVARELERRGIDWTLFEAEDRAGGVIRSGRVEGRVLDWGPQRTRLVGPIRALVEELGLGDRVVTAREDLDLMVFRDGRLRTVPFGVGGFLRSDAVSAPAKLRLLLEPLTRGHVDGERVADYFVRKFGEETYRTILGPLYGGLYASDPRDMEAERMLLPLLEKSGIGRSLVLSLLRRKGGRLSPPPACSFDEGMQVLPDALAARLGDRVRLSTPVHRLERAGDGWIVETERTKVHAEELVVCLPKGATAGLLRDAAPDAARRIASLTSNPLAVVHLHSEARLEGMGFQVSFGEGLPLKGVTYNASLFDRDGVYTAYLGGAQRPEVAGHDDEELGALARAQFRFVTGVDADRVLDVSRIGMPAWDLSWRALDGLQLPPGVQLCTNWESRPGLPGRFVRARRVAEAIAQRTEGRTRHADVAA